MGIAMFQTTLAPPRLPAWSTGKGAIISLVSHAIFLAAALAVARPAAHPPKAAPVEVTLKLAPPPPPPPPLGGGVPRVEAPRKPVPVKKDTYVHTNAEKQARPPDPAPAPTVAGEPGGKEGGVPGGKEGGSPDGVLGGELGGTGTALPSAAPPPSPPPVNVVLPFGEGMTRPQPLSGPEPVYPRQAREAKVEGTLLVKCVITTTGTLRSCRVLKSLPFLDQPVLEALAQQRYTPVTFQGRPVDVEYVIPFRFKLQ
jgi:protein TonB